MRHRMTLQNASTGFTYALVLEAAGGTWQGSWQTLDSSGQPTDGPRGALAGDDAYATFQAGKRAIESEDEDVIGVDWVFEEPLPPWLAV